MSKVLINDLVGQFQHTVKVIVEEIELFSDEEWLEGISFFQVPVKQVIHLLDILDYFFSGATPGTYRWGQKFGGGWWELSESDLPDRETVIQYARELEKRIVGQLSGLDDLDLSDPSPIQFEWADTRMGFYVYVLRHTLHHHGQLAALSVHHGHPGGSWE